MNPEKQEEPSTSVQVEEAEKMDKEKETCSENEACLKKLENLSLQETESNDTKEDSSKEMKESKKEEKKEIVMIKTNKNCDVNEPTNEPTSNLRGSVEVGIQVGSENMHESNAKEEKKEQPTKCEKCGVCEKCEKCKGCVGCSENEEKTGADYRVLTDEDFFDNEEDDEYYDVEEEEVDEEEEDEEEEEDDEELQNNDMDSKYSVDHNNNIIKLEMITEAQLDALEKMVISEHETFTMNSRMINDADACFPLKFSTSSYSGYEKELMDPDRFVPVDPNKAVPQQCQQMTPTSVTVLSAIILGFGVYVLVTYFKSSVLYKMFMRKQ